jgi:putative RNA 2'-phosphotransferase
MNNGFVPTDRQARTGEFTPPGISDCARSNNAFDFSLFIVDCPFHVNEINFLTLIEVNRKLPDTIGQVKCQRPKSKRQYWTCGSHPNRMRGKRLTTFTLTQSMKHSQQVDKLAKFLTFIIGRQPDEFGLVPDTNGYVKTKDLLKALAEESGWRHVRMDHLREVAFTSRPPQIELAGNLIRAADRSNLYSPELSNDFPKLLYYPIRRRAYPVVLEKGVPPNPAGNRITLAVDQAFAGRLGRRIDQDPIILVVHSATALSHGATLWRFGKHLFLSDRLPMGSFSGPPPPKQPPEPQKKEPKPTPPSPGSYLLDLSNPPTPENRFNKPPRHRKNEWKRERKRRNRRNGFD